MEIKVFVLPGGELQIFVDGPVSVAQAEAATRVVLAQLQAAGVAVATIGPVEQHKDAGVTHVHVTGLQQHEP